MTELLGSRLLTGGGGEKQESTGVGCLFNLPCMPVVCYIHLKSLRVYACSHAAAVVVVYKAGFQAPAAEASPCCWLMTQFDQLQLTTMMLTLY